MKSIRPAANSYIASLCLEKLFTDKVIFLLCGDKTEKRLIFKVKSQSWDTSRDVWVLQTFRSRRGQISDASFLLKAGKGHNSYRKESSQSHPGSIP